MENNEVSSACTRCGQEAGEPDVMCEGCKDVYLCRCGSEKADPNDTLCPGCEEIDDDARREAEDDECPDDDDECPDDDDDTDAVILAAWDAHDADDASTMYIAALAAETASATLGRKIEPDEVIYVLAEHRGVEDPHGDY